MNEISTGGGGTIRDEGGDRQRQTDRDRQTDRQGVKRNWDKTRFGLSCRD